ncbi:hypothetical protein AB0F77_29145 [Streptomyces sp. NPDC026672]|uniref:hypothetical protein n=1 Tax=unclassified Streptomyces TaxID=2593676 RepID=UPI0033F77114
MLRGLAHVLAWSLATGAAVTLSWWGVHTVLEGTAYDPPRALPITAADATTQGAEPPRPPASHRPPSVSASATPGVPVTPSASAPSPTPSAKSHEPSVSPSAPPPSPTASGQVKAYDTGGGRAVFDLGSADATLVSATPGTGWSMQVWKTESWIRVEFTRGTDRVSVFCTWHDGPPRVEVGTY